MLLLLLETIHIKILGHEFVHFPTTAISAVAPPGGCKVSVICIINILPQQFAEHKEYLKRII